MRARKIELLCDSNADNAYMLGVSEDLAWEAARDASELEGYEVGSDEFLEVYKRLNARYSECAIAYGHLKYLSALTLNNLLGAGLAITVPDKTDTDTDSLTDYLAALVQLIFINFVQVYAVATDGWYSNEEWNRLPAHLKTVTYVLQTPKEKDDNND